MDDLRGATRIGEAKTIAQKNPGGNGLARSKRKNNVSEEERKRRSDFLKAKFADPVYRARHAEWSREAMIRRNRDPKFIERAKIARQKNQARKSRDWFLRYCEAHGISTREEDYAAHPFDIKKGPRR